MRRSRLVVAPLVAVVLTLAGVAGAPVAGADTLSHPYLMTADEGMGLDSDTPNLVPITGGTDDGYGAVILPFPVSIFGHEYPAGQPVFVTVNGTMQFGVPATAFDNVGLPTDTFSGPTLLPFWDDFDVTPTGHDEGITWGIYNSAPNRVFTVSWRGYLHHSNPLRRIQFKVSINEWADIGRDSLMVFSYFTDVSEPIADGSTATIGMQEGGAAGQFAQFSVNEARLSDDFGVVFESVLPTNTVHPQITGNPLLGQSLSASTGTWQPAGSMTYAFQWARCDAPCGTWSDIPGATTSTYAPQNADLGKYLFVAVKATNGWGQARSWAFSYPEGPVTGVGPVNQTAPVLSGTARVGQQLSVTNGTWSPTPSGFSYEWWRCIPNDLGGCVPSRIADATTSTYTLTSAELTGTVYVNVTATVPGGSTSKTSNSVGPVLEALAKPVVQRPPAVRGTPAVGSILGVTTGTWSGSPETYAYEWWRCVPTGRECVLAKISGATSSRYLLTEADLGARVTARVTASNSMGSTQAFALNDVGPVTVARPVNVTSPVASGTPVVGSRVSVTTGTWTGSPTAYAYQWLRCMPTGDGGCIPEVIPGASAETYQIAPADVSGVVYAIVTATNPGGSTAKSSNAIGPITLPDKPSVVTAPVLSGAPVVGSTVSVTTGTWTGSPTDVAFQWWRCIPIDATSCAPSTIAGATTSTYVLTEAELTGRVYVKVTATNAGGSSSKVSNAVGPVTRPAGSGTPSDPADSPPVVVSPADPGSNSVVVQRPGAVTGLTASIHRGRVVARWKAPTATGGAATLGYRVRMKSLVRGASWGEWRATTSLSARIRITKRAPAYRVQVTARNSAGTGPVASARVSAG